MSKKQPGHLVVPIFIPNLGCPHRCIFCEQERITSRKREEIKKGYVNDILERAVKGKNFSRERRPQVAFYGGTFTNLPRDLMESLLETVRPYIDRGLFDSIRISTRPDAMDRDILLMLRDYGVRTVELGVQSMDDHVLFLSRRGHSSEDTISAISILREIGFEVGIQLMPGLPGDSRETFRTTTEKVKFLSPDMVRLYPALVIKGTGLLRLYEQKKYTPLTLKEAVSICAESCVTFETAGIPVIRIGLMSSPSLLKEGQIVAGPWHPAFGFLVRSAIYHDRTVKDAIALYKSYHKGDMADRERMAQIKIFVPPADVHLLRGYKNSGIDSIERTTGLKVTGVITDESMLPGTIRIES